MLKIRLSRGGKKNSAFFRIVVTEHARAATHGYKEVLGYYNPFTKEFKIKDLEKVKQYASNGVTFSPRVEKLIKANNIAI
ncbi:MAG: 30S ribosomal protein S16 [Candidatus Gracilibacteria bacterium]|nr:30S ribosomal protein S16 [Candidatus Gracilibacteria bacterium]